MKNKISIFLIISLAFAFFACNKTYTWEGHWQQAEKLLKIAHIEGNSFKFILTSKTDIQVKEIMGVAIINSDSAVYTSKQTGCKIVFKMKNGAIEIFQSKECLKQIGNELSFIGTYQQVTKPNDFKIAPKNDAAAIDFLMYMKTYFKQYKTEEPFFAIEFADTTKYTIINPDYIIDLSSLKGKLISKTTNGIINPCTKDSCYMYEYENGLVIEERGITMNKFFIRDFTNSFTGNIKLKPGMSKKEVMKILGEKPYFNNDFFMIYISENLQKEFMDTPNKFDVFMSVRVFFVDKKLYSIWIAKSILC